MIGYLIASIYFWLSKRHSSSSNKSKIMPKIHPNATTTPRIRRQIQQSDLPVAQLAQKYSVGERTIRRWKKRDSIQDKSSSLRRLPTTLTPDQEWIVVELRRTLLLPLDDLLHVAREFVHPELSRAALGRLLRREGISKLSEMIPSEQKTAHKQFKDYDPGFLHVDIKYLPQMPDEIARSYLFVAIDRATRWVFIEIYPEKTAACAADFMERLQQACPFKIQKVLTDNGTEFTDRFTRQRTQNEAENMNMRTSKNSTHAFEHYCCEHGIEHRLTRPYTPKTNGMVERFNGRIATLLKTTRFKSSTELHQILRSYHQTYLSCFRQRVLNGQTPCEKVEQYRKSHPHLFLSCFSPELKSNNTSPNN